MLSAQSDHSSYTVQSGCHEGQLGASWSPPIFLEPLRVQQGWRWGQPACELYRWPLAAEAQLGLSCERAGAGVSRSPSGCPVGRGKEKSVFWRHSGLNLVMGWLYGEGNRHFRVSASVAEGVVGLFTRREDWERTTLGGGWNCFRQSNLGMPLRHPGVYQLGFEMTERRPSQLGVGT